MLHLLPREYNKPANPPVDGHGDWDSRDNGSRADDLLS